MAGTGKARVTFIIPFHDCLHQAERLCRNIYDLADELTPFDLEFIFIDDEHANSHSKGVLETAAAQLFQYYPITVINCQSSKDPLQSFNQGLERAAQRSAHVLLLHPNTIIYPGAISEMFRIMLLDPMTALVNPRSSTSGLFSFPHSGSFSGQSQANGSFEGFQKLRNLLPDRQYVPACDDFCLFIRNTVVREFGSLDPAYGGGAIRELIARANRHGFRAVLANHAFVDSGAQLKDDSLSVSGSPQAGSELFSRRYPEFSAALSEYLASPAYCFEKLVSDWAVRTGNGREFHLAIDCHCMFKAFNGTFTATVAMIKALATIRGDWRLSLLCAADVAGFHGLDRIEGATVLPYEPAGGFDLMIKFAQPFSLQEYQTASTKALKLVYTMLDTISWDCDYLRDDGLDTLWKLTAEYSDGLVFISRFGCKMFNLRFTVPDSTLQLPCTLSLSHADYFDEAPDLTECAGSSAFPTATSRQHRVLVFGNQYHHKFMAPTLELLSGKFPGYHFLGFGIDDLPGENVTSIKSGTLTTEELECLYHSADTIIFPSMYEGFGFPVPEALARGKVVFARDTELSREIRENWSGPGKLVLYPDNDGLVDCLKHYDSCVEQSAQHMHGTVVSPRNWQVVAGELRSFIGTVVSADRNLVKTRKRVELFRAMDAYKRADTVPAHPRAAFNGTCWHDFRGVLEDVTAYLVAAIKQSPLLSPWQGRLMINCITALRASAEAAYNWYLKMIK